MWHAYKDITFSRWCNVVALCIALHSGYLKKMSNKIVELLTVVFEILDGRGPTVATVCGVTLYVAIGRRM